MIRGKMAASMVSLGLSSVGEKLLRTNAILKTVIRCRHPGVAARKGMKKNAGSYATTGSILFLQKYLRFYPGLNVGIARNLTLFALETGRVMITCEKVKPNWNHFWIKKFLEGRQDQNIYRKYYHIIPQPQKQKFNLVDQI